mmetsp:Transcript_82860/g.230142  ORF Transcript_82860/g.230142 Transcript_82860/m.230142 type:complete len:245 (-) Transcript_82860:733-1467(-)
MARSADWPCCQCGAAATDDIPAWRRPARHHEHPREPGVQQGDQTAAVVGGPHAGRSRACSQGRCAAAAGASWRRPAANDCSGLRGHRLHRHLGSSAGPSVGHGCAGADFRHGPSGAGANARASATRVAATCAGGAGCGGSLCHGTAASTSSCIAGVAAIAGTAATCTAAATSTAAIASAAAAIGDGISRDHRRERRGARGFPERCGVRAGHFQPPLPRGSHLHAPAELHGGAHGHQREDAWHPD